MADSTPAFERRESTFSEKRAENGDRSTKMSSRETLIPGTRPGIQILIPEDMEKKNLTSLSKENSAMTESNNDVPIQGEVAEQEKVYIAGIKLYLVLFGTTLVVFIIMLDTTIVVTAIPKITNDFDSLKDIGWYGSTFMLALAALQPLVGKLYQNYSSKVIFLTGLSIFELGSLVCALANSSPVFIIGRAIAGAGGSGLLIGFLTIVAAIAPLQKRPLYLGIVMGIASLGLVLGPVLGGIFTQHATWHWCFWINLPFGAITWAILAFIHIPDSIIDSTTSTIAPNSTSSFEKPHKATIKEHLQRLDLPGFALFTPACTMLLLALSWGGATYPWSSATIIGLFCGAVGMTIIFILWEKRQGEGAMIPLSMLKRPVIICATLTMILSQGSLLVITYYLPLWFQVVKDASPTMGGVYYLPSVGSQVIGSVIAGSLTSRLGYYTPFAIAGLSLTSLASGLFSTLSPSSRTATWLCLQLISGFSRGLTAQQPLTAIQAVLPPSSLAQGNAFLMFAQVLGGSIFVTLAQTIFQNQLPGALERYAPNVDKGLVLSVGATGFREVVGKSEVTGVVEAYNWAITKTFYIGTGAAAFGFLFSWGLGWTNIKKKKAVVEGETVA